jgi:hypothetical protein
MAAQSLRLLDLNSNASAGSNLLHDRANYRPEQVSVSTADVLPLLVDAALTNRAWLEDFAEDTMDIPRDLYEVLLAYRQYRQAAA